MSDEDRDYICGELHRFCCFEGELDESRKRIAELESSLLRVKVICENWKMHSTHYVQRICAAELDEALKGNSVGCSDEEKIPKKSDTESIKTVAMTEDEKMSHVKKIEYENEVDMRKRRMGNDTKAPMAVLCPHCKKGISRQDRKVQWIDGKRYWVHKVCPE